jgi:SOS-response transcriptional repressor LexA
MEGLVSPDEQNLAQVPRLLDEGKAVVLKQIYGNSMLPFIRGGVDSVRLRKPEGVKVGDIVLAVFGGRPIVHRVIAIDGTKVTLMGDGNPKGMTEKGDLSNVLGIVDQIISPSGRSRKPSNGKVWRRLLPVRKYLLRIYRKWNKLFD